MQIKSLKRYHLTPAQYQFKTAKRNAGLPLTTECSLTHSDFNIKLHLYMKMKEESEKFGLKLNVQKTKIMPSVPITSWEIVGKQWKQCQTLLFGARKSLQMVTAAMKLKDAYSLEEKL